METGDKKTAQQYIFSTEMEKEDEILQKIKRHFKPGDLISFKDIKKKLFPTHDPDVIKERLAELNGRGLISITYIGGFEYMTIKI